MTIPDPVLRIAQVRPDLGPIVEGIDYAPERIPREEIPAARPGIVECGKRCAISVVSSRTSPCEKSISFTAQASRHAVAIETSWPATTIDGDHGIVSGMLSVSRTVEFLLNLSVGPPGGAPENYTYLEFLLPSGHALAQGRPYANLAANGITPAHKAFETSATIVSAAAAGLSAAVTARPITSMSAPFRMASAGVATRR